MEYKDEILYDGLIESLFNRLGLVCEPKDKYYVCQNPIIQENNPSFIAYRNGFCCSYNGDIEGESRIPIKRVCVLTGSLDLFVEYTLLQHNIPSYKLNRFRELLLDDKLNYKDNLEKKELKKLFSSVYISENDVRGINYTKPISIKKFEVKAKKRKSEIGEEYPNSEELSKVLEYMESRKLITLEGICEPITVIRDNKYRSPAIKLTYPNKYVKYRLLDNNLRFMSNTNEGTYQKLFELPKYKEDNITCIVGEGEINGVSSYLSEIKDIDFFTMQNCNSMVSETNQLDAYKNVIVIVDYDKFDSIKEGLLKKFEKICPKDSFITITYTNTLNEDFNKILIDKGKEYLKYYIENKVKNILNSSCNSD